MIAERPTPIDAAEQVAALPRRTAHAAYALLAYARDYPYGPHRASEVVSYDSEAVSAQATGRALASAMHRGLADRWGEGLWTPTVHAGDLRQALEDRFLRETE